MTARRKRVRSWTWLPRDERGQDDTYFGLMVDDHQGGGHQAAMSGQTVRP